MPLVSHSTLSSEERRFAARRQARNASPMRITAILTLFFFSVFWGLDFFVLPDHVVATFGMRLVVTCFAGVTLWASYRRKRFFTRHLTFVSFALPLSTIWSIAVMCWLHQGYESPYYAGMNMVVLVIGMLFSWSLRQEITFYGLVYAFYMSPLLLGLMSIHDTTMFLSNQCFFISTLVLTAISQRHRVIMEQREFYHHRNRQKNLNQLRRLASTDMLTGLFNRAQTLSQGEREFLRCERYRRPFSAIMVDIDCFKEVNDTYTHSVGDVVIQEVAQRLLTNVRAIDIVGRFGGEEFLILLPETEATQASNMVAARIQGSLRDKPVATSQGPLPISVSMGVAGSIPGEKLSALIHRADEALYAAKHRGRDQTVEATFPLKEAA